MEGSALKIMLDELEQKYFDLVHLARSDPDNQLPHHAVLIEKYPNEYDALADPEKGDWQHGFNSGMLASVRLLRVFATTKSRKRQREAVEEFPFLDT